MLRSIRNFIFDKKTEHPSANTEPTRRRNTTFSSIKTARKDRLDPAPALNLPTEVWENILSQPCLSIKDVVRADYICHSANEAAHTNAVWRAKFNVPAPKVNISIRTFFRSQKLTTKHLSYLQLHRDEFSHLLNFDQTSNWSSFHECYAITPLRKHRLREQFSKRRPHPQLDNISPSLEEIGQAIQQERIMLSDQELLILMLIRIERAKDKKKIISDIKYQYEFIDVSILHENKFLSR